jgi:hydroxymethylpyrimidine/phosphomethylpyrimidine kinase
VKGRVLIIAGSDSGGGAGIQADIKTVTALGGYAMTAITALTAQNTLGVHGIFPVPEDFIAQQIDVVLSDIGADAIKTGMLHSAGVIEAIVAALQKQAATVPVVVDPVMVAKGGAALLQDDAVIALKTLLLPRATLLTPNIPEAEALTGLKIVNSADMQQAGHQLLAMGAGAVLIKGGHMEGDLLEDWLVTAEGVQRFISARIHTRHTHGTGCTLASAIATGLAQRLPMADAVDRARLYVTAAIRTAPGFGQGHGPLNHGHLLNLG